MSLSSGVLLHLADEPESDGLAGLAGVAGDGGFSVYHRETAVGVQVQPGYGFDSIDGRNGVSPGAYGRLGGYLHFLDVRGHLEHNRQVCTP